MKNGDIEALDIEFAGDAPEQIRGEDQRSLEQDDHDVQADYVGFGIGDEFVVGYGLDYKGKYRNLPYVGVLKHSAAT